MGVGTAILDLRAQGGSGTGDSATVQRNNLLVHVEQEKSLTTDFSLQFTRSDPFSLTWSHMDDSPWSHQTHSKILPAASKMSFETPFTGSFTGSSIRGSLFAAKVTEYRMT